MFARRADVSPWTPEIERNRVARYARTQAERKAPVIPSARCCHTLCHRNPFSKRTLFIALWGGKLLGISVENIISAVVKGSYLLPPIHQADPARARLSGGTAINTKHGKHQVANANTGKC